MSGMSNKARQLLVTAALVSGAALGGGVIAQAATSGSSTTSTTATTAAQSSTVAGSSTTAAPDPATISHGPGETLLTGDVATKVSAAALAKVPGATVIRVETDSNGSPYEAHLTKSDGTRVTVYVDKSFNVTSTVDGFGGGPRP
jgi:anti-sigma factor RsiW